MKKLFSLFLAVFMLFTVVSSTTVLAAEASNTQYYPSSGLDSGHFTGKTSSSAVFDNLPNTKQLHISYSIDGASGICRLRFYSGSSATGGYIESPGMQGDGITSIWLPYSGRYTVVLYYDNGTASNTVYYAYTLYTEN